MVKSILGAVAGVIVWMLVVVGVSFVLRAVAPDIAAALNAHTTAMALGERLGISFGGSILSGLVAALIGGRGAALAAGVLLLLGWGYFHIMVIWHQFPLWYHLTFLVSLPLLSLLGGRLTGARR